MNYYVGPGYPTDDMPHYQQSVSGWICKWPTARVLKDTVREDGRGESCVVYKLKHENIVPDTLSARVIHTSGELADLEIYLFDYDNIIDFEKGIVTMLEVPNCRTLLEVSYDYWTD